MTDAPRPLEEQLQSQREELERQIQDLETQLIRTKEGYLKVLGALEFAAIQKQQSEAAVEVADTENVPTE